MTGSRGGATRKGEKKERSYGRTARGSVDGGRGGGTRKKNKVRGEQEVARVKRKAPVARPRAKRAEWSSRPSGRNFPGAAARDSLPRDQEKEKEREGEKGKGGGKEVSFISFEGVTVSRYFAEAK